MSSNDETIERPRIAEAFTPVAPVVAMVAIMWAAEIIDLLPGTPFDRWGIEPRQLDGLIGIPLAPLLHGGFGHLLSNTIPFFVLGAVVAVGGARRWFEVTVIITIISGLGTWLFGRSGTVHIGASGVVFGYLTYLIARGFVAHRIGWIFGGMVVAVVYGGLLWGLLPRPGVSFTGHLFGALGGVAAALLLHGVETDDDTQT